MRMQTRFGVVWSIVLVVALSGLSSGCRGAEFVIDPYVQRPGQTEMTVRWGAVGQDEFTVEFGTDGKLDGKVVVRPYKPAVGPSVPIVTPPGENPPPAKAPDAKDTPVKPPFGSDHFLYAAKLTDLLPGKTYDYRVSSGAASRPGRFQTVPENPKSFNFIAYGDNRSNPAVHKQIAARFLACDPAFILNTGDLVTTGSYREWKPEFFDPLAPVIRSVPLWPAIGNHDGDYRRYFSLPNNGCWYSFDYGNVHVVSLESRTGKGAEMLDWLENDLAASKATWKIVMGHISVYDVGGHYTAWGRDNFVPVFRKYGVDIVFTGHSHTYQRFRPMFTTGENEKHPITYIVTAGGGASLTRMNPDPYLAAGKSVHHFMAFTIEGAKLSARTITADGREIDSFTVTKTDGVPDAAYLASAMPEEKFGELRALVAQCLQGLRISTEPLRAGQADTVTIQAGAGDRAMKFEIRLEDRTAKEYRMEPVKGESVANGTTPVELRIKLRKPGEYADPKTEMGQLLIEFIYEIDGQRGSVFRQIKVESPKPPPAGTKGAQPAGDDE